MVAVLALALRVVLARKNRRTDRGKNVEYEMVGKEEAEEDFVAKRTRNMGKAFIYML